jgi:hypothetical protein
MMSFPLLSFFFQQPNLFPFPSVYRGVHHFPITKIPNMKKFLFLFALAVFSFISCQKENLPPVDDTPKELELGALATASATGLVTDEQGHAVPEAYVTFGNKSATTDENGVFRIEGAQVRENLAQVKVTKAGYFTGSRTFQPKTEPERFVRIMLLKKNNTGSFAATAGGRVELPGQVAIDFQADGIVDENGQPYSGTVQVAIQYIDPTASDLDQRMPGNLTGFSEDDGLVVLGTYGMIGVELTSSQGQALQLAQGKPAAIAVKVPSSLQGNAPASIPLWHYDENVGIWMEEGEASLENGYYVGEVAHFSFWNCDYPYPLVQLSGSIFYQDLNDPIENIWVRITVVNGSITGYGYTDSTGVFSGLVPKDEALLLEVIDLCNNVVYSANIGPFSANVTLDPIILTAGSFSNTNVQISGMLVDCDGAPVTDGYVKVVTSNNAQYIFFADSEGNFEGMLSVCDGGDFLAIGVDLENLVSSNEIVTPSAPVVDLGQVEACDNELEDYIEFNLNGADYIFTEFVSVYDSIPATLFTVAGSGTNQSGWFSLTVDAAAVGSYPAQSFSLWLSSLLNIVAQNPEAITVEVLQYGPSQGDVIKGNFSGTFLDMQGNSHDIDGTFRAIREF